MSLFPDKGFIHKGPIHSSSDIGLNGRKLMNAAYPMGNSHGGMVCVKGQWYIFDHRRTGKTTNRQPVAERIETILIFFIAIDPLIRKNLGLTFHVI